MTDIFVRDIADGEVKLLRQNEIRSCGDVDGVHQIVTTGPTLEIFQNGYEPKPESFAFATRLLFEHKGGRCTNEHDMVRRQRRQENNNSHQDNRLD